MTEFEKEKQEKIKILRNTALKALDKKLGENSYYLGQRKIPKVPLICSTGSLALDNAVGIGGFPAGRIIEIGGQESSSKSTLTLINIAEIQRQGKLCAYIDAEQSFDPSWAKKMNVNVEELLITQPDTAEEAFETLYEIIDSGVVSYIVIDSTNALIPRAVFESEDANVATMGLAARILSQNLPKIQNKCKQQNCTVVFISQIRATMDKYHPEQIGIGNALKYFSTLRLKTARAEIQKDTDGVDGQSKVDVKVTVFKNKIAVPFKKAQFTLYTGEDGKFGIDTNKEILEFAVKYDIVKKAGSWFSYGEERLGQGFDNVKKFFDDNPATYEIVKSQIMKKFEEEREKGQSADDTFEAEREKLVSEIEDKPKRTRKTKIEGNTEELSIVNESEAEIVEEKAE